MKLALKIGVIILAVILLIVIVLFIMFQINVGKIKKIVSADMENIKEVDLSNVDDGIYKGSYKAHLMEVELNVEVKDHKIVKIEITKQESGPGYEGRAVIDRIIDAQSIIEVDAKTGATGSSSAILLAVQNALNK
jgi:uncharacterized protein with FMN-binding domain